jgi:hypothetical protein
VDLFIKIETVDNEKVWVAKKPDEVILTLKHRPSSYPQQDYLVTRDITGTRPVYHGSDIRNDGRGCLGFVLFYTDKPIHTEEEDFWYQQQDYRFKLETSDLEFMKLPNEAGHLHFGLELEISTKLSPSEFQYIIENVKPKQEKFFFFKHDGSVTGRFNGTELVTMPMTPRRMRKEFRTLFSKLEVLCKEKGKSISDFIDVTPVRTNGLHIHVDKDSFVRGKHYDKLWKNKFGSVWNQTNTSSMEFIQKLSRRVSNIATNQYCKPHENMRGRTPAWKMQNGAVCLQNSHRYASARDTDFSVEVRVFQSIWDIDHIFYCIDLVAAVHKFCGETDIITASNKFPVNFTNWLFQQNEFRFAKKGLKTCV